MNDAFHAIVARLSYPMLVITASAATGSDGRMEKSGCLVGFSTQCSLEPPVYAVWVSQVNHTHEVARSASHLGLHFLSQAERGLAELFGEETGDAVDKFARCDWFEGPHGVPVLDGCRNWVCGRVLGRRPTGDHTAFFLDPVAGQAAPDGFANLGFQDVKRLDPGHPA